MSAIFTNTKLFLDVLPYLIGASVSVGIVGLSEASDLIYIPLEIASFITACFFNYKNYKNTTEFLYINSFIFSQTFFLITLINSNKTDDTEPDDIYKIEELTFEKPTTVLSVNVSTNFGQTITIRYTYTDINSKLTLYNNWIIINGWKESDLYKNLPPSPKLKDVLESYAKYIINNDEKVWANTVVGFNSFIGIADTVNDIITYETFRKKIKKRAASFSIRFWVDENPIFKDTTIFLLNAIYCTFLFKGTTNDFFVPNIFLFCFYYFTIINLHRINNFIKDKINFDLSNEIREIYYLIPNILLQGTIYYLRKFKNDSTFFGNLIKTSNYSIIIVQAVIFLLRILPLRDELSNNFGIPFLLSGGFYFILRNYIDKLLGVTNTFIGITDIIVIIIGIILLITTLN